MDLGAYGHQLFTVGFLHLIWHKQNSKCTYIFAQTLLVTQKIDATSPPGYGQPSDPLSYIPRLEAAMLFHTDYMTLVYFGILWWHPMKYFIVSFLNSWVAKCGKGPGSLRYLGFRTTGRHAGCKRSVPTSIASQGKNGWIGFPILGKSVTEHMTLVAIRHLAVAWQSNLKRHWRGGSHQQTWQLVCTIQEMSAPKVIADYQSAGPKMKEDHLSWMYGKFSASKSQNVLGFIWCSSWKPTDMGLPGVRYLREKYGFSMTTYLHHSHLNWHFVPPRFQTDPYSCQPWVLLSTTSSGLGITSFAEVAAAPPLALMLLQNCVQAPQIPTESHDILGHTREYGNYNIHIIYI